MKHRIASLVCCALLFVVLDAPSQEEPSAADQFKKIAQLGPGVHQIQKNKKGHITSCVVVGSARISTVLGKTKGLELARDKANLNCSEEFVKWLKKEVKLYQSNDEETVILLEGSEEAGAEDALKEQGKSVEKLSKKMESISQGLVRGLTILHKEVESKDKVFTIVKGWKADTAEGVKKIAKDLSSDEPVDKGGKKGTAGAKGAKNPKEKGIDKEIEDGSVTSDDAADFLPKRKK